MVFLPRDAFFSRRNVSVRDPLRVSPRARCPAKCRLASAQLPVPWDQRLRIRTVGNAAHARESLQ